MIQFNFYAEQERRGIKKPRPRRHTEYRAYIRNNRRPDNWKYFKAERIAKGLTRSQMDRERWMAEYGDKAA